jgi:amino acid transporter
VTTTSAPQQTLERRLGPFDGAAIIVSNVIGAGILFTPPVIAMGVPNGLLYLSVWLAGGLLAFAGAMAYAELAALRPRAGGEYVYLRDAFGPVAAFLTGWTSFVAGFSGAIAAVALVAPFYIARFAPAAGDTTPFFAIPIIPGTLQLSFSPQTIIALALIWALAFVHVRGVGPGRFVSNLLATLKVSAFVLFIAWGFTLGSGESARLTEAAAPVGAAGWFLALLAVGFTYSGWNAAAYVAEEIKDPGRNAPRAFALGTAAVIAIYLLMNALYLYVVPVGELATLQGSVLDVVADRLSARRDLLQARRRGASDLPDAGCLDPGADDLGVAAGARGPGRRAHQLHGICDLAVLGAGRGGAVRAAAARTERRAPVQDARLSARAGTLCAGGGDRARQRADPRPRSDGRGCVDHPGGHPALLLLHTSSVAGSVPRWIAARHGTRPTYAYSVRSWRSIWYSPIFTQVREPCLP